MSIFKCKMCGGALEISNNETVATCEYCSTQQTLPKLDDEKRANLYDRANHFRRNNEFDKAMGIYEQILNEDSSDSEAYWSLVLCRYGIEYVEDPTTHKRVPTVNRAQFTSIFDDDNYKSALQYADGYQKSIYEEEAKQINEIQKGILAISQKEEPFDVFICYKETDNSGRRTHDSVLANDLYHQLTQEGFKVFFARITLEDKLGSAYEPYIFAALNSSKVMVVLGTKPEFFNAVWVKNEWSRYLALIKNGAKKMLIPAYKDMDPYDLPEEFSHLQAQDMSKLGFMQDLIRGIKKIAGADEPKETVIKETIVASGNSNIEPLLERAFMFLEDGEWQSAEEYCEKVLDIDPKCARAYLGKLMAELHVSVEDSLYDCDPFDGYDNYQKVMRFADENLKTKLEGYIEHIYTRNENERLEGIYNKATNAMNSAKTETEFKNAANIFKTINDYKDSATLIEQCLEKAEIARKEELYNSGVKLMSGFVISKYEEAIKKFEKTSGWKDSKEQIEKCKLKIEEIKAKDEADRLEKERQAEIARKEAERIEKRNKKFVAIAIPVLCAIIAFGIVLNTVIIPNQKRNEAIEKYGEEFVVEFENLKVGDTYTFGSYEQDDNITNGKEEIEWLVLSKKNNKIFVISKYCLNSLCFDDPDDTFYWDWDPSVRKWLNNTFLKKAFSYEEQKMIPKTTITTDVWALGGRRRNVKTEDRIFLLSIAEGRSYFKNDDTRKCQLTDYAKRNYSGRSDEEYCNWWLRSGADDAYEITYVGYNGQIYMYDGAASNGARLAVRPALWIDLNTAK